MASRHLVLVPVDGSVNSLHALTIACRRARSRRGVGVLALNVQPSMPSSRFVSRAAIRDHQERMAAEVFRVAAAVAKREKVRVQLEMVIGLPAIEIVRAAGARGADEIVMGTRGMGGVKGLFMGSVAMKVVHLSKVPVTLVK
jgi:nucleotide-binding universal stress UspA family protein